MTFRESFLLQIDTIEQLFEILLDQYIDYIDQVLGYGFIRIIISLIINELKWNIL